jgi:Asp-tRNA(Asn)/Glu-tRNA(Gln) amidotransferase A subunit family amidase
MHMSDSAHAIDTIAQARRLMAAGKLSPSELVAEFARRITEQDATLRAWVHPGLELARERARALDRQLGGNTPLPPLFGIPFGAKDIIETRTLPTEAGSRVLAGNRPDTNATVIDRLEAAGAVLMGKTATTEFAHMGGPPATVNPWDHRHTPGGSSSGSAASVAASMAMFALGSQTAGSMCRPAAYNGLTVLKASFGRVSKAGVIPAAWTLDHIGAFTHTVEDTLLVYNAMAGPDPRDDTTLPLPVEPLVQRRREGMSLGLIDHPYFEQADASVLTAMDAAVATLRGLGVQVRRVTLPDGFDDFVASQAVVMQAEMAAFHADWHATRADRYTPEVRGYIAEGLSIRAADYLRAQRIRQAYRQRFDALFDHVDVLVSPAAQSPAPAGHGYTGSPVLNLPFTHLGIPVLALPTGFGPGGILPVGMQLASRTRNEQAVVDMGLCFQAETDWHLRRPAPVEVCA